MNMLLKDLTEAVDNIPKEKHILIVRVITSSWADDRGVHTKTSINYLKRRSEGYNILKEDCCNIDVCDVIDRITNLCEVPDGIYELITCNVSTDWETGHIDDYDYKLIAVDE